jgi:spermidine/putrescine-binding protein
MTPPGESPTAPSPAGGWTRRRWIGAAALAGLAATGCNKLRYFTRHAVTLRGEIHVLIWDSYISTEILEAFQAETGIQPILHLFSSNDQLPGLLQERKFPYDLVMPSAFMAQHLRELGLLRVFNRAHLPRLDQVDRKTFNSQFDPANDYIVPYVWGATGIGYNARRIDGLPKSWADLFTHQRRMDGSPTGISVLDDARFTLGNVLIYSGISPNAATEAEVERAGEVLIRLLNQITFFESNDVARLLATGAVDLAMAWSGDVTRAMKGDETQGIPSNHQVRISLPREGSILFKDCFAMPAKAENRAEAEAFVNFLLRPEVAAAVTDYSLYATTVTAARSFIDRRILNGPSYFMHPAGTQLNFTLEEAVTSDEVYQRVWKEVKAGKSPSSPAIKLPAEGAS